MKRRNGYALIELLIVVTILGIIAAIPVAGLVRSLIAANEATAIGDVRTVISSQAAYQTANGGWYEANFGCLTVRGGCIPSTPTNSPTFLDSHLASLLPKSGYGRQPSFGPAPEPVHPTVSATSVSGYTYTATPTQLGQTGVRGFGGDGSGVVCYSPDGGTPSVNSGRLIPGPQCLVLK